MFVLGSIRAWLLLIIFFCSIVAPWEAHAQGDDMKLAKESFSRGRLAFDDGQYFKAEVAFEESLAAFPHFRTIFNIALCKEKLGKITEAVSFFEQYVNWPSQVPDRDKVRKKIVELKKLLPPEPEPEPEPESDPDQKNKLKPVQKSSPDLIVPGWITLATGVAGIVTGSVLLAAAQKKRSEMIAVDGVAYDTQKHDKIIDKGRKYERSGWIAGGVGIAVLAVGATMLLISGRHESKELEIGEVAPVVLNLDLNRRGGSVAVAWSF